MKRKAKTGTLLYPIPESVFELNHLVFVHARGQGPMVQYRYQEKTGAFKWVKCNEFKRGKSGALYVRFNGRENFLSIPIGKEKDQLRIQE